MSFWVVPCDYNKLAIEHIHLWDYDTARDVYYCRRCLVLVHREETLARFPTITDLDKAWEKNHERSKVIERDCRERSDESATSKATGENPRYDQQVESKERLVVKTESLKHNWRHDRDNLYYICDNRGGDIDGGDCPGCGAVVLFKELHAYDKTSQSARERIEKVNQLWDRKINGGY